MSRRAKIVCTLGPATSSPDQVSAVVKAGMDVDRLNMSHGDHDGHQAVYQAVRAAGDASGRSVGVLVDLQGPKIRLGRFAGGLVTLTAGQEFTVTGEDVPGDQAEVSVTYPGLAGDVRPGTQLLVDDGRVVLEVTAVQGLKVRTRVLTGGPVSDHKGLNLPGVKVSVPALTDKDAVDLPRGAGLGPTLSPCPSCRDPRMPGQSARSWTRWASGCRSSRRSRNPRRWRRSRRAWPRSTGSWSPAGTWAWNTRWNRCRWCRSARSGWPGGRPSRSSWLPRCSSR